MKIKICFSLFLMGLITKAFAAGAPIDIDQSTAKTSFVAVGKPAMLRIHGESKGITSTLTVENQVVNGALTVKLESFKTGIDTRDEHMKKKYLETEKYPDAVLQIKNLSVKDFKPGTKMDIVFKSDLTLHGVTKPVEVKANIEELADGKFKAKGVSNLLLSDFKVDIPTYAGIKVADSVEFDVEFQTK